jgi:hypothetical protein
MNFQKHYFNEAKPSPRKDIQHLYNGEDGKYSMKPDDFLELIDHVKKNNGKLDKILADVSLKIDGFSLKFGMDASNRFFIESARSGLVYDSGKFRQFTIQKKGESDPISEGYEDILQELSQNKQIQNYLKSINTKSGIKIHTEALYMPLGKFNDNNSLVKFVATWYKKEKIGTWATFVILNVTDAAGNPFPKELVDDIKNKFQSLSSEKIKFEDTKLQDFKQVDLSDEIQEVEELINTFEIEFHQSVNDILNDQSRKRSVLEQKKKIKNEILKIQKKFSEKLGKLIVNGKFGDEYEGLVFDLVNGITFKIISDRFKKEKKIYNARGK